MARIRSIKPQFWTSEQIAECSPNARLLFIGMWNFCDDYGVHPASVARLKMEIFPADALSTEDIRRMVAELLANGLIEEYEIPGEGRYWWVTGWDRHQKPDTKTGLYPLPSGAIGKKIRRTNAEDSPNGSRTLADHSPTDKEKEKEKEKSIPPSAPKQKKLTGVDPDFQINETGLKYAKERGVNVATQLQAFLNHHQAKATKLKDWQAGWRVWCDKSVEFGRSPGKVEDNQETKEQRMARLLRAAT